MDKIPLVAALVFTVLAVLSSVSMNSYMSTSFAGAVIVCGLIYAALKNRKKNLNNGHSAKIFIFGLL